MILPRTFLQYVQRRFPRFKEHENLPVIGQTHRSVADFSKFELSTRYLIKTHYRNLDLIYAIGNLDTPKQCRLCGFESREDVFKRYESECIFLGGRLIRYKCPSCEVIFGPLKMLDLEPEMIDMDYRLHYSIFSEGDSTERIVRAFHLLRPRKDGLYLDYGCGVAHPNALKLLRDQGYSLIGFEPSLPQSSEFVFKSMHEISRYRFDGIFSHNVLEHLFDPVGITKSLSDLLTPGGLLVHATPCFEYLYEYTRFHVYFFTGGSLQYLASRSGMRVINLVKDTESDFMAAVLDGSQS